MIPPYLPVTPTKLPVKLPLPLLWQPTSTKEFYKDNAIPRPTSNISQFNNHSLKDSVTIVTAYFNIGFFQKGENKVIVFKPNTYREWMRIFKKIHNPVIAYFDDKNDMEYFNQIRAELPSNLTQTALVNRNELWSFGLYSKIKSLYRKPTYPKFHPNTVIPEYTCAVHAKYEVLLKALQENPFKTRHFSWVDIGYFRSLFVELTVIQPFTITKPPEYDPSKVSFTEINKLSHSSQSLEEMFFKGLVWLAGGFFIGDITVMAKLAQ